MNKGTANPTSLGIFVSYASGCLTDHLPHGDGLICFSLLNGLARRGHRVFAYTPHAAIVHDDPRLQVKAQPHASPADSLADWEHLWRAGRWLKELLRTERIDLAWRMHPYEEACPSKPPTAGRPLIIGPWFRGWPADTPVPAGMGQPRFGFGIGKYLRPRARRGWEEALRAADLILCATPEHAREIQVTYPAAHVIVVPVMVDPPVVDGPRARWTGQGSLRLVFVANLYPGKNARVFCETVAVLRERGVEVHATLIGDGVERPAVEEYIAARSLGAHVLMTGRVANTEVFEHLRASHLLVSTSVGEPYGRGIAEAMAIETPVVCHRSGGPAEFVTHEKDGLLVDEMTAAAYATAIAPLAASSTRWESLATEAGRTAAGWRSDVVLATLEEALISLCQK